MPPASAGMPNHRANVDVRCRSISEADGESSQPPAFMFMPEASRSAAAPGTVPAPLTYAMNRGWPGYIERSNTMSRRYSSSASSAIGSSGTSIARASRTPSSVTRFVTGRSRSRSRSSS